MDEDLASRFLKKGYVRQGISNLQSRNAMLNQLLEHKRLPKQGWDDSMIEFVLSEIAMMDSNNFRGNCGVGEREGRVYSSLVKRRHFGLAHGIGRSGDLSEVQPKAAGSSLLLILTQSLTAHALKVAGLTSCSSVLLVPMATGMTLSLCMLSLRAANPTSQYVIWPRIDQKSCFKSILTAGFIPLVVENRLDESTGELNTDLVEVERLLQVHGAAVCCVLSTTSCFAPRQPDRVDEIAKLCRLYGVGHVINNAYGLQCAATCKLINRASTVGTVTAVVQSMDKNFMVPVGGSVVCSPSAGVVKSISSSYPGRASSSAITDLFITLLSMGEAGYRDLLLQRCNLLARLQQGLLRIAEARGERLVHCPRNSISIGMTLCSLTARVATTAPEEVEAGVALSAGGAEDNGSMEKAVTVNETTAMAVKEDKPLEKVVDEVIREAVIETEGVCNRADVESGAALEPQRQIKSDKTSGPTFLGSMLFQRLVSGCRVVESSGAITVIGPHSFRNWGSHCNAYPWPYLTAACAIGSMESDIEMFFTRLEKCLSKIRSS